MRLLRWFVVVALLANAGYAAWHLGALSFFGLEPATERDPGRLEQQIRPTALRVLTPQAAAAVAESASAAAVGPPLPLPVPAAPPASAAETPAAAPAAVASGPWACLEIGPLDSAAVEGAERALAAVFTDRGERPWVREQRPAGMQYVVFVGPILSRDAARQRRDELIKLKLSYEAVELPDGKAGGKQGGYSLGRHDSEAAAQSALDAFRERGLRNARVAPLRESGSPRTWLRLDSLQGAAADAVRALPASQLGGQAATSCVLGSVMSVAPPR